MSSNITPTIPQPTVNEYHPFCSQTRELIDFTKWMQGNYESEGEDDKEKEDKDEKGEDGDEDEDEEEGIEVAEIETEEVEETEEEIEG